MEPWAIALLLKPLVLLVLAVLVFYPAKLAVKKWLPEGKLRSLLLRRIN